MSELYVCETKKQKLESHLLDEHQLNIESADMTIMSWTTTEMSDIGQQLMKNEVGELSTKS